MGGIAKIKTELQILLFQRTNFCVGKIIKILRK
jgi:hypothetical protein